MFIPLFKMPQPATLTRLPLPHLKKIHEKRKGFSAINQLTPLILLHIIFFAVIGIPAQEPVTFNITMSQTAVLDPANWDKVFAGEKYFDAVRPMLVRFPGATTKINEWLQKGYTIDKLELVLQWKKQEDARPERGRGGWGADQQYVADPGQWHVLAYPLRHPWSVDNPEIGPTFTSWINGIAFWERGGARGDGTDRQTLPFGPLPLHAKSPEARLDITAILKDSAYGKKFGERLRSLEECGFQIHKQELLDMKYRNFYAYDWAVSTGYIKIWVDSPILTVTMQPPATKDFKTVEIPAPTDITVIANSLKEKGGFGKSSMAMPVDMEGKRLKVLAKPAEIPDWMWTRINELRALHNDPNESGLGLGVPFNYSALFDTPEAYFKAMRNIMLMAPRTWQGHTTTDFACLPSAYANLLPPAVIDHLKLFWTAWLHPDVEISSDQNLGGGTHRGGPTYFRGYTHSMGTMNFNHNAISGALLGGQLIQSPWVNRDASYGLENLLLRAHVFANGAHQEIGDTYYQAITMAAGGAIAKFSQDPLDRVMGLVLRDRLVEPLVSMYNPDLRRMTHPMARGDFSYQMLLQEGPYNVLHTLSPNGVLMHLNDVKPKSGTPATWGSIHGLSILGDEAPPQRIAMLSPWTDAYLAETMATLVDKKSYPWRVTATDASPGTRPGGWHLNYLSRDYSIASRDNTNHDYGTIPITAQWRRENKIVTNMEELTTLQMNMGINGAYTKPGQSMAEFGIVQRDNMLVALKALPRRDVIDDPKNQLKSLHTTVAIVTLGDVAKREVWINDKKVDDLSGTRPGSTTDWKKRMVTGGAVVAAKDGDIIAIQDGVTYVGLIPISANTLERDREVEISYDYPTILIHNFLYRSDNSLDLNRIYGTNPVNTPTAGFILEMGDQTQYPAFADFRAHLQAAKLISQWNAEKKLVEVSYTSGGNLLEMGYDPARYPTVYRRVNGEWPYLPEGIQRDTPWAIQGRTGTLKKNGATLQCEPGRTGYLQAIPDTDTYIGYNPLPDPTCWALTVPGNIQIKADGRISITRVVIRPKTGNLWIDSSRKTTQNTPDMATSILVFGMKQQPVTVLNGEKLRNIKTVTINGVKAWVIPLEGNTTQDIEKRYLQYNVIPDISAKTQFHDWYIAGPFPRDFATVNPPETAIDLKASYTGLDGIPVQWKRIPTPAPGTPSLGAGPIDLETIFTPSKNRLAYAYTSVISDKSRDMTMYTGSDQDIAVWINKKPVMQQQGMRVFYLDQDRTKIHLNKGENTILLKLAHDWEGWKFNFRIADVNGMTMPEGVRF